MSNSKSGSGTVKFFNDQKGFGFILLDDMQTEIFVHQSTIQMEGHRTLIENQPVEVTYHEEAKGLKAITVDPDLDWAEENGKGRGNDRDRQRRDDRYGGDRGGGGYRGHDSNRYRRDDYSYSGGGGGYGGGGGGYGGGGGGYGHGGGGGGYGRY